MGVLDFSDGKVFGAASMRSVVSIVGTVFALLAIHGVVHGQEQVETLVGNARQVAEDSGEYLDADVPVRAQRFWTGRNAEGYTLTSVGIRFSEIVDPSPGTRLLVTINRATARVQGERYVVPGDEVCALSHPESYVANAVNHFAPPTGGCVLAGDTTSYFVVVERTDTEGGQISLSVTDSSNWDTAERSWGMSPHRHQSGVDDESGELSWDRVTGESHMIDIQGEECDGMWCATLTVGASEDGETLGWSESGRIGGDLSDDEFTFDEEEYELDEISLTDDDALTVIFETHGAGEVDSQHTRDRMDLWVDELKFNLGAGELQSDERSVRWTGGPSWSAGQSVMLKMVEIASPPRVPEGLVAMARDSSVDLAWVKSHDRAGGAIIKHDYRYRTTDTDEYGDWETIHDSGADQSHESSYRVSGLDNDTEYRFQVRAANSNGPSGESNEAVATPEECDAFWCGTIDVGQVSGSDGSRSGYHAADSLGSLTNSVLIWNDDAYTVTWVYTLDSSALKFGVSSGEPETDLALRDAISEYERSDFNTLELGDTGYHFSDADVTHNDLSVGDVYQGWVEVDWDIHEDPLGGSSSVPVRLTDAIGGL